MKSKICRIDTVYTAYYAVAVMAMVLLLATAANASVQYMTRSEAVIWETSGSKFGCMLSHDIEGFGKAVFEHQAGEQTRFYLNSQMARMKSGKAALIVRPPAWSSQSNSLTLGMVAVKQGTSPISLGRKMSERMLAELQKGMFLDFKREPWYGDQRVLRVTLSSIGFRQSHQGYLRCLADLLPVNYQQIERSSLYYDNDDDDLKQKVKQRLDQIIAYIEEDPEVKTFYLDGHTDSEGIRNENLIKSQRRTEKVMNYLIEKGIARERIIARWHGERYQVSSNKTAKGRAKNRRVTLRLSKEEPQTLVDTSEAQAQQVEPAATEQTPSQ
ncbi:MAG: OmpA family protein [Pseudomonadota bacterium]